MAQTDRAFRALARSDPAAVLALLRVAIPGFMSDVSLDARSVADPKLDLPPPVEADLLSDTGEPGILHVEGQGYRDSTFIERVFRYHLLAVLRYPKRKVTSVALWLVRPPKGQRLDRIETETVTARVYTVVLRELPAGRLLEHPETVCFAPGADAEGRSDEELCRLVAQALRRHNAGWQRLSLAVATAGAAGRYGAMMTAMEEANLQPPLIQDLIDIGRDVGRREGAESGMRESLLAIIAARNVPITQDQVAKIEAEHDVERLLAWLRRAAVAGSMDEVLEH